MTSQLIIETLQHALKEMAALPTQKERDDYADYIGSITGLTI